MTRILAYTKLLTGLILVGVGAVLQTVILLVLLPSRVARIRSCIVFERLIGYSCTWLAGVRLTLSGAEHLDSCRPAIYVLNHTSIIDLFITLRIIPYGSVGVVKQEVVRYPFFGQMYLLTGHLRVDRGRHAAAVAKMQALGELVRRAKLSIFISPEGTRSRDGRLRPFKKGVVHLALQTGLPVVPVVVQGAYKIWKKSGLALRGGPVRVDVLPPVDTSGWSAEQTDEAIEQIHALFRRQLPAEQQPAEHTAGN
jgi:1-acyl-sn-glycerol-3-phosphate acyltransferase